MTPKGIAIRVVAVLSLMLVVTIVYAFSGGRVSPMLFLVILAFPMVTLFVGRRPPPPPPPPSLPRIPTKISLN